MNISLFKIKMFRIFNIENTCLDNIIIFKLYNSQSILPKRYNFYFMRRDNKCGSVKFSQVYRDITIYFHSRKF